MPSKRDRVVVVPIAPLGDLLTFTTTTKLAVSGKPLTLQIFWPVCNGFLKGSLVRLNTVHCCLLNYYLQTLTTEKGHA